MSYEKVTIGNATLYRGDCLELLEEIGAVGAVITDPPYGMAYQSNFRQERHMKIANDKTADIALQVIAWARGSAEHSVYAFGRWDNVATYPAPRSLITWVKNNWSMGDLLHEHARQTEVAFFWPGPNHGFPTGRPTDVITYPRTANENHPTEKPVGLMAAFIRWTAGIVCDPFMGSGSTGVAAIQLGRPFIGVERETKYFDIACKRIEQAVAQGQLFAPETQKCEQVSLFGETA
jgi:DNA modification methylase